jgi:hypothetical protein
VRHTVAHVTLITSENPKMLTKQYSLGASGELVKKIGGSLVRGKFEVVPAATPEELARLLSGISSNQALTYGVPLCKEMSGSIASRKEARNGDITRTRDAFGFESGPGWLLLDIDPGNEELGAPGSSWEEVYTALDKAIPGFRKSVPHVLGHSASTFLYKTDDGTCLRGEGGKRVYVLVSNADDIPRAGEVLYRRLQAQGCLHYFIDRAGRSHDRSLIDKNVFAPEHLDFVAGGLCLAGIEQRRPEPVVVNNTAEPLDTGEKIKNISSVEEADIKNLGIAARLLVEPLRMQVREKWIAENMKHKPAEVAVEDFRRILEQGAAHCLLDQGYPILLEDGTKVLVSEVLSNPRHYHGRTCFDPVEPDYDGNRAVGKLFLTGARPLVYSFAHGGTRYYLNKQKHALQVVEGHTEELTDACIAYLAGNNVLYRCEDSICEVSGKMLLSTDDIESHLDRQFRFFSVTGKGVTKHVDCPNKVARRMLIKQGQWQFYQLDGVVTLPVLRLDGSILDVPGYDPQSKLIYDVDPSDEVPSVPSAPTAADVKAALTRLWYPFRMFPFAGPADRGAALAAMLTTALRPVLPSAPGFLINAPAYGTGKTLFALSIAAMTGMKTSVTSWPANVEEQRKSLTSALRSTYGSLVLDNLEGNLYSSDLAAVFTTPVWTTRLLGKSEDLKLRTNCMMLATGNNVYPIRDLARRFCTVRINADVDRPEKRVFDFSPRTLVEADPARFRCDVLTVLRGFVCDGAPRTTKDITGSFEDWDRLVRQCVCWCRGKLDIEIEDPMLTQNDNYETDPDQMKISNLLSSWYNVFEEEEVTVKKLIAGGERVDLSPEANDLLHAAIEEIADDRRGNQGFNTRILGRFLDRHRDCIVAGIQLRKSDRTRDGSCVWHLVKK